jgi:hypothetical protein
VLQVLNLRLLLRVKLNRVAKLRNVAKAFAPGLRLGFRQEDARARILEDALPEEDGSVDIYIKYLTTHT